jgi:hypothetical protein
MRWCAGVWCRQAQLRYLSPVKAKEKRSFDKQQVCEPLLASLPSAREPALYSRACPLLASLPSVDDSVTSV